MIDATNRIVPSCRGCNSSMNADPFVDGYPPGWTSESGYEKPTLYRCPSCSVAALTTPKRSARSDAERIEALEIRFERHVEAELCDLSKPDANRTEFHAFETGAVRGTDANDVRFDLVTPIGLRRVARAYAEGSRKYSDFNCENGIPLHDLINHALNHLNLYLAGDRSEDHLGHCGWNVLMACHSEESWPKLNAAFASALSRRTEAIQATKEKEGS